MVLPVWYLGIDDSTITPVTCAWKEGWPSGLTSSMKVMAGLLPLTEMPRGEGLDDDGGGGLADRQYRLALVVVTLEELLHLARLLLLRGGGRRLRSDAPGRQGGTADAGRRDHDLSAYRLRALAQGYLARVGGIVYYRYDRAGLDLGDLQHVDHGPELRLVGLPPGGRTSRVILTTGYM